MYSNIIHDLEASLNNARDVRTLDLPGEMSNMLSSFSNRLETLMNQSERILRTLRTSVEVLPENDPIDYGEESSVPTANFNDSSFFVRDQRIEGAGLGRNFNSSLGNSSSIQNHFVYKLLPNTTNEKKELIYRKNILSNLALLRLTVQ